MARDVCMDCEQHFPGGEGLKDGLCRPCRIARREMSKRREEAPAAEEEQSEEEK